MPMLQQDDSSQCNGALAVLNEIEMMAVKATVSVM